MFGGVFFSANLVVGHGARWRVGSGFNIPIIGEPWLGAGSSIPSVSPAALALQRYYVGHYSPRQKKNVERRACATYFCRRNSAKNFRYTAVPASE